MTLSNSITWKLPDGKAPSKNLLQHSRESMAKAVNTKTNLLGGGTKPWKEKVMSARKLRVQIVEVHLLLNLLNRKLDWDQFTQESVPEI
jgi:hypothetical protein